MLTDSVVDCVMKFFISQATLLFTLQFQRFYEQSFFSIIFYRQSRSVVVIFRSLRNSFLLQCIYSVWFELFTDISVQAQVWKNCLIALKLVKPKTGYIIFRTIRETFANFERVRTLL